jgi:hypothetical protein
MSFFESLFEELKDVECSDELIDNFSMEPIKTGYRLYKDKKYIANVNFIDINTNESFDMEYAQDNPDNYKVIINEIKQIDKVELYINKIKDLGFVNISQE